MYLDKQWKLFKKMLLSTSKNNWVQKGLVNLCTSVNFEYEVASFLGSKWSGSGTGPDELV